MQYSVSPRVKLTSFGPKPSENVSTRTPMRRAIRKWPSSCTKNEHAEDERERQDE